MIREFSRTARTSGLLLFLFAVSACSSDSPEPASSDNPEAAAAYLLQLEGAIEGAIEDGVSQTQLDLLESTRDLGYLPYEVEHEAMMNYASCLAEHGIEFEEVAPVGPPEFPKPNARISVSNESEQDWMDSCYLLEMTAVDSLYQTQPLFRQARRDLINFHRKEILSCLETAVRPLPEDATVNEISHEVFYALTGAYIDSPDDPPAGFQPVDCLSPLGIDWDTLVFDFHSPEFG